ncbi:MAG TPA: orotidine-5'-phosphate decarboxylase [Candidatus Paceibacterota bacterium]
MAKRNFRELLGRQWDQGKFLCVGLDSDLEKIPVSVRTGDAGQTIFAFNRSLVDATYDLVGAYKLNSAFYEAHGDGRFTALRETILHIKKVAPDVPVILDAKRADIGNTNAGYVESMFGYLDVDAITVHPYMGRESLQPFLDHGGKGIFVLCRTSNPGAGEFQDLEIEGQPLYQVVAQHVAHEWNTAGNCGLVVGATYPEELGAVRKIAPDMPILIPGIGAQHGDLAKCVAAAKNAQGRGFIIAIARAIIFASSGADYAEAARRSAQTFDGEIRKLM